MRSRNASTEVAGCLWEWPSGGVDSESERQMTSQELICTSYFLLFHIPHYLVAYNMPPKPRGVEAGSRVGKGRMADQRVWSSARTPQLAYCNPANNTFKCQMPGLEGTVQVPRGFGLAT